MTARHAPMEIVRLIYSDLLILVPAGTIVGCLARRLEHEASSRRPPLRGTAPELQWIVPATLRPRAEKGPYAR